MKQVDCPDCGDRGKVSLLRSWRGPSVADQVCGIVRSLKNANGKDARLRLTELVRLDGKNPSFFLQDEDALMSISGRFVRADDQTYFLLLLDYHASMLPGEERAGVLLLSTAQNQILDGLHLVCSNREAGLYSRILDPAGPDGAQVAIIPEPGGFSRFVEPTISYRLYQWQRITTSGVATGAGKPERDGICRLGIGSDRLVILELERK